VDVPLLVPLATPYTDDTTTLSEIRLIKIMRWHRERGAEGWVVGSEVGEVNSLSHSERKQLNEWVIREAAGSPVIVNVTCNTTAATVDLAQHAARHGAKSAYCMPPFATLTEREMQGYLAALRRHGQLNVTLIDPSEQWNHLAIEATSIATHALSPLEASEPTLGKFRGGCEFKGEDGFCSPVNVFGADLANRLFEKWFQLGPIIQGLFRLGGHARVAKAALEFHGFDPGPPRPPLQSADENVRAVLQNLLTTAERG
jgi:dihydrodipicolinate synthase/N-acetylneuraminate lyase